MKISYANSDYYKWFVELGYPQLDIVVFEDGEWAIREFYNCPIIPSMTQWKYILQGMRHIEITKSFVEKWCRKLDLTRREIWDAEEAKTAAVELEHAKVEEHRQEFASEALKLIKKNEDLVERVAKNGIQEINLENIVKHVPASKLRGHKK
jgi:hypothetical protein